MNALRVALLSFLVIPACDSPGGGGGGINCTQTPDLPICRADTSGGGDATGADTTSGDTTSGQPDTQVSIDTLDTTPTDTTTTDTASVDTVQPACSENARRCSGNSVQLCSGDNWLTVDDCGSDICEGGSCIVQELDCQPNERRCSGASVEVCDNNHWTFQQACPSGCSAGSCQTTTTGSDDCNAILACADASQCFADGTDQACFTTCLASGSTTGKSEASGLITCFDGCSWDATCAFDTCSPQRAKCYFEATGSGDCTSIDTCSQSCSDQDCVDGCYESATANAQAQYLWVIACAGLYCDLSDSACLGQVFSAGEPCEDAYLSCFN